MQERLFLGHLEPVGRVWLILKGFQYDPRDSDNLLGTPAQCATGIICMFFRRASRNRQRLSYTDEVETLGYPKSESVLFPENLGVYIGGTPECRKYPHTCVKV